MNDNNSSNSYYIYFILDTCGVPFYIGKGKNDRHKVHFSPKSLSIKNYKNNKIKKILQETGKFPIVKLLEQDLSEADAFNKEKEYIKKYGLKKDGGILTNVVQGGQGSSYPKSIDHKLKISKTLMGHLVTHECREKIRKKLKDYYNDPLNRLKARISQIGTTRPTLKGVPLSKEIRKKISNTLKGRTPSINAIEASMKKITIKNEITNEQKTFLSIKDANKFVGVNCERGGFYSILKSNNQLYVKRQWRIVEIDEVPFTKHVNSIRCNFLHFQNTITGEQKIFSSIGKAIMFGITSAQFLCDGSTRISRDGWIFNGRK